MSENIAQKLVVEALGAFALCFFSIGAVVLTQGEDIVAIGIATGLAIGIMVAAAAHISGGHYNPAVTIGMLATKRISVPDGIAYIVAQAVGSVLGAGAITLAYLDVDRNRVNLGLPEVGTSLVADPAVDLSASNAVAMEAILTFFLVLVIFGTAVDKRSIGRWVAPWAIGITIAIGNMAGVAASGAAMNPIRWFGPAIIQQDFANAWVWIVGPIVGGLIAALLYDLFLMDKSPAPAVATGAPDVEIDVDEVDEAAVSAPRPRSRRKR
ncbi:MAG: aquaporin [Thermomicrobiales bacterium]|nr:aquaporin [Thermomicrobiales bacterium]